ncbi:FAD-dependent pyridine nucleotide-disulfide oxidoreductase [Fictibacillus macauensis ZFHKF-1]|uniref:Ferredoxin--NADP reductase n=1 Tax=Fictibacillus macauensis ZFHKF-1 TaxID=1196324 RepID=I8UFQ0_9BACL|nr:NAD(P)/FAD-dependent oxidoreductase [Fictibacillus macauensis]EIT85643.1 FAD-dependent pyridine nucleotide-disulfide oxidoreductase [Fictibacillus macauensis ZFHKF-1]
MKEENLYDITIIGGGPTGLFAAFYGGMRQMKVKVIESMPQLGGQLAALYPEKYIYDVAGFPKILAQDLVNNLIQQAEQFEPHIVLEESVKTVEKKEDIFHLTTDKETHYSKAVIITAGVGAFQPRRLELPNASQYEGKNLLYFVNDLQAFQNKKVLVAGGGDSAVDWSLMLEPLASEVTLTHRRPKFRAHEHSVDQLLNSSIKLKTPYQIKELVGNNEELTEVILENEGIEEKIAVDAMIVNYGFVSSLGPIKNWGLDIERNSIIVNSRMETNIKGIYAAGDICTYDGKIKLIAAGFGEAPTAVNNAKTYIDPKAKTQPQHSTSLF